MNSLHINIWDVLMDCNCTFQKVFSGNGCLILFCHISVMSGLVGGGRSLIAASPFILPWCVIFLEHLKKAWLQTDRQ